MQYALLFIADEVTAALPRGRRGYRSPRAADVAVVVERDGRQRAGGWRREPLHFPHRPAQHAAAARLGAAAGPLLSLPRFSTHACAHVRRAQTPFIYLAELAIIMIGEIVRRQIWPPPVPANVVDPDAFAAARRRRLVNRCERSSGHCCCSSL